MGTGKLKKLLQQKNVSKHWGSIKLGIGQIGIYLAALNMVMISLTLWQTGWIQQNFLPLEFWQFALILVSIVFLMLLLAWKIDMPSYFAAWNDQFYKHHNPLRDDIQEVLRRQTEMMGRLGRLEKKAGIENEKPENVFINQVEPKECFACLSKGISDDTELYFCAKHIGIAMFILEKADLHPEIRSGNKD